MRDNKPLELEAVNYVCSRLAKINLKYSNPNYDENGGDLIVINEISHDTFKSLNVQVKGRDISSNNSNVKIHKSYVRDNFVCFLYLRNGEEFNDYLYCFFDSDVSAWEEKKEFYYLNIPQNSIQAGVFFKYEFNREKADKIRSILDSQIERHHADIKVLDLTLIDNTIMLWEKTNFLPDANLTRWYLDNIDLQYSLPTHDFFLTCLAFLHSDKLEEKAGVDYMFSNLKSFKKKITASISDVKIVTSYYNHWLITYTKSSADIVKLKYNGAIHNGLKLTLGDNEEWIEGLLIDNGDLQIEYQQK